MNVQGTQGGETSCTLLAVVKQIGPAAHTIDIKKSFLCMKVTKCLSGAKNLSILQPPKITLC